MVGLAVVEEGVVGRLWLGLRMLARLRMELLRWRLRCLGRVVAVVVDVEGLRDCSRGTIRFG